MVRVIPKGLLLLLSALLATPVATSRAEHGWNWRVYKIVDGLPSAQCTSVTIAPHGMAVDPHGKVLVTHAGFAGLTELDGYGVKVIRAPQVLTNRVYESPAGQLWTVVPDGLLEFYAGVWSLHAVPEVAAEVRHPTAGGLGTVPLYPLRQGLVLFLVPGRLVELDC